jgi:hypothetical protein
MMHPNKFQVGRNILSVLNVFLKRKKEHIMPKNRKGRPSGPGHESTGLKEVKPETLEVSYGIEEKYTEGESGDPLIYERHPNRNLDKPNINKPRYS